jgi:hypothetical protein
VGPLEQEVADLLEEPLRDTPYGIARRSGDTAGATAIFMGLDRDRRDELIFLSLAGVANAIRRVAGKIDEVEASTKGAGDD